MTDILVTRDGLIGNSPRYTGHTSPPYQRYLKDDAGNAINLTGVSPSAFTITFVNQSNPLFVKSGTGTFSVPSPTATQGLASYQYSSGDVADAGNWYAFWTVQLSGEPAPRVFDPDFLSIILFPSASGGGISVTVQDVNLSQVNGTAVSSSNPVPTSGPITAVDGGIATVGTTTDTSSANTTIGLLKAIKAYLGGTLNVELVDSAGTNKATISAGGAIKVDNSAVTQPVSAASLPLPTGASTAAKQPALGTAGTASTDVLTVQGITSMTALKTDGSGVTQPVSGTVTVQQATASNLKVDLSGTAANATAIKVDNSGVTQPVSGTVTVTQATGSNLHSVLDSGSTTAVTQATASNLNAQVVGAAASGASNTGNPVKHGGAFNTTQPTVTNGQAVDAQYTARGAAIVATGVDAFAVNAAQSGTWNVNNVSGTVSLPTGAATSAKQPALGTAGTASSDVLSVQGIASMTALKVDGSAVTQPVSGTVTAAQTTAANLNATATIQAVTGTSLAADQTNSELRVSNYVKTTTAGDTPLTLGQATMANSLPVALASDQGPKTSATATRSNVVAAASDTSLLASNASRKGALFFNDSTAVLYLAYGSSAASTTSYTVQIPANGFFELPPEPVFTGAIRGIWSAVNGNVRITEMS